MLLAVLALALGITLAGAQRASAQGEPERVAFDQDLTIKEGETVLGDVSVTNGNLIVYGTVEGKASIVNGKAFIYGKVLGDVVVLTGGGATLYPDGSVGGNVFASGDVDLRKGSVVSGSVTSFSQINREDGSTVRGTVNTMQNPAQALENLVQPVPPQSGKFDGSFFNNSFARIAGVFSIGILSAIILLLAAGMTSAIPNRVRTASSTLQAEPGPSIVLGVITAFLIFPVAGLVAVVLTISVVGIVLLPVLAIGLIGAFLLGLVVVSHWLGKHLHDTTKQGETHLLTYQSPTLMIEVLLGVAVILASTLIPALFLPAWISVLMFLLVYSVACIGIGSTVLSRFGTLSPPKRHHQPKIMYPTQFHSHYGAVLPHTHSALVSSSPPTPQPEHTNTRPLGPVPALPREE